MCGKNKQFYIKSKIYIYFESIITVNKNDSNILCKTSFFQIFIFQLADNIQPKLFLNSKLNFFFHQDTFKNRIFYSDFIGRKKYIYTFFVYCESGFFFIRPAFNPKKNNNKKPVIFFRAYFTFVTQTCKKP